MGIGLDRSGVRQLSVGVSVHLLPRVEGDGGRTGHFHGTHEHLDQVGPVGSDQYLELGASYLGADRVGAYVITGAADQVLDVAEGTANLLLQARSEEHTSELQSHLNLVCRLLLEKKKKHTPRGPHPAPRPPAH